MTRSILCSLLATVCINSGMAGTADLSVNLPPFSGTIAADSAVVLAPGVDSNTLFTALKPGATQYLVTVSGATNIAAGQVAAGTNALAKTIPGTVNAVVGGILATSVFGSASASLATNAFRMVPANDPQGLTNWWFVDGTNEVHWSVATDTNTLVVTDAGGCNPYALGTFYYPDWTNNNGWRFWPAPVYAELHDPTEGWIYGNGVIPGVLNGGGEDTPGSVYVSYGAITNVTTNATTAYVDAAVSTKATPLDATNAALAVVAPYTAGATLGATALQPGATNGFTSIVYSNPAAFASAGALGAYAPTGTVNAIAATQAVVVANQTIVTNTIALNSNHWNAAYAYTSVAPTQGCTLVTGTNCTITGATIFYAVTNTGPWTLSCSPSNVQQWCYSIRAMSNTNLPTLSGGNLYWGNTNEVTVTGPSMRYVLAWSTNGVVCIRLGNEL